MQEREDRYKDGDRLLADEKGESSNEIEYKEEWHLRTGWVILFSISMMMLVFLGMVTFAKTFIAKNNVIDYFEASPDNFLRRYYWTITDIMANPDGVYRPMITINGQFPGPMIECNEGDTIVIEVDNRGVNATSIHFHGIFQNGTNWMDGTTGITQCPIAPGRKFRYEFTVKGQSGTYYYHGHQAVQIADGLYGPLIIHSKEEKSMQKIQYDTDRVVMLQDYYHELSSGLLIEALEPGSESSPIPDGALINGLNTRDCSLLPHRSCDNTTATLPSFYFTANAYHRLRFVNVGAFAWFQVSMDEHEFAITEVDGTDIMPSYESRMMISPAQRYSMIINTNHASLDSFWLRARMVTHCWKTPELPANGAAEVRAVVRYVSEVGFETSSPAEPTSKNWDKSIELHCKDMNTTPYIPVAFEPAPAAADHSYFLRSNLEIGNWRLERGFFNKSTFRPDLQHPTLHRTIEGLSTQNESFTSMSSIEGEGFGWLAIRFVADNPGVWAFHCHLMWHGEAGMVMQFLDRVDEVEKWGSVPEDHKKLCEADIGELEKGAVPKDDIWFGFGVGG
ncbi:putative iron transport multicopper oxidase fio1 precursor protein [Rutstroemia sp. NJR-2017a BBW]|nr:putative iron transport multicopper oxidase fio1 precursor protein [Rutstroemia sp. NJR-2017a BBW]